MRVFALTHASRWAPTNPEGYGELDILTAAAGQDRFGRHELVSDAEQADLYLFVKAARPDCHDILSDPLYTQAPDRCFLFELCDNPFPYVPGVYSAIGRGCYSSTRTRAGHYLNTAYCKDIQFEPEWPAQPYLWSFMGRFETHPVRRALKDLAGPGVFVSAGTTQSVASSRENRSNRELFLDVMRQSLFVACPRGYGVSSYRLFEAMRMGRCPVILSDSWVPPVGPQWELCSVRVAESDVNSLSMILESLRPRAAEMGRAARSTWEMWFSPEVSFHRIVEWCLDIQRSRRCPERLARWLVLWRRPLHWIDKRPRLFAPLSG